MRFKYVKMNRFEDIITPNFAKTPISILDNMLILSNNDSDNQTVSQAINSVRFIIKISLIFKLIKNLQ